MGRSGYVEDFDDEGGSINLYRGSVERSIRGKRGQAFLREMAAALDAMPVKELIGGELVRDAEHVCAIGSVAVARGLDVSELDEYDGETVGKTFGIAESMAKQSSSILVEERLIEIDGAAVAFSTVPVALVLLDRDDRIRPSRLRSSDKLDGIMALCMSLNRAITANEANEFTFYIPDEEVSG